MTIGVLALIVVLGAVGVFGMRSTSVTASGGGYQLTVEYAAVSRAGLDTPWTVTVRHPGGFTGPITLATTDNYFTMFETQGLTPARTPRRWPRVTGTSSSRPRPETP